METTKMDIVAEIDVGDRPVYGVTHDGDHVWVASGASVIAIDPKTGEKAHELDVPGDAGTTFDGTHLYQLAEDKIQKIDPKTGEIVAIIPAPGKGRDAGLTWAEGMLWVGQYRDRKIHLLNPDTGEIIRTIESNRFVTGVTWVGDELWHGVMEAGECELRKVDSETGEVLCTLVGPPGIEATGLCSDGENLFCGGGDDGKIRVIRRPG